MSTFTDWNGPQGSNVRAADLLALAKAYQEVQDKFLQYQEKLNYDDEPIVGSRNIVTSGAVRTALNALQNKLNSYLTITAADTEYQKKLIIDTEPRLGSANPVESSAVKAALDTAAASAEATYATKRSLDAYVKIDNLSTQAVITAIQTDIDNIQHAINNIEGFTRPILKATDYVEGLIKALSQIIIEPRIIQAPINGSNENGIFYTLGMLTGTSGTAYIQFSNTANFTAKVDFTAIKQNAEWKGNLSVLSNSTLEGLKFLLCNGTEFDGTEHVYLCAQSKVWVPEFASQYGYGTFNSIELAISGVNIAPTSTGLFKRPNAEVHMFAYCDAINGSSASAMSVADMHIELVSTDSLKDKAGETIFHVTRQSRVKNGETIQYTILELGGTSYDEVHFNKRPSMSILPEGSDQPIETKFVTTRDIETNITPVGTVIEWGAFDVTEIQLTDSNGDPVFDSNGDPVMTEKYTVKNIPAGWLALNGEPFDATVYPSLATIYPEGKLPEADFKIIKAAEVAAGDSTDSNANAEELINYTFVNERLDALTQRVQNTESVNTEQTDKLNGTATSGLKTAIESAKAELQGSINQEIVARTEADTALGERITTEADIRLTEDNRIEDKITQEVSDRTEADTALGERITAEADTRATADTTLQDSITTETREREESDAVFTEQLAGSTDSGLKTAINSARNESASSDNAIVRALASASNLIVKLSVAELPTESPSEGRAITNGDIALVRTQTGSFDSYTATVDTSVTPNTVTWSKL